MSKRIMQFLVVAGWVSLAFLLLKFAIVPFLSYVVDANAEVECLKLQSYSEDYASFYLTEWEAEMCDSIGIEIDAPVGNYYEKQN